QYLQSALSLHLLIKPCTLDQLQFLFSLMLSLWGFSRAQLISTLTSSRESAVIISPPSCVIINNTGLILCAFF
uniref:Uncharacterized protein n=1 Tax=Amphimedon queenslandica TaxID=400682 RepID=A0A1X7U8G2_AMPQE